MKIPHLDLDASASSVGRVRGLGVLFGILLSVTQVFAQNETLPRGGPPAGDPQDELPSVIRIVVDGLEGTPISESLVFEQMETQVGSPFKEDVFNPGDYQRLWRTLGLIVTSESIRYDAEAGGLEVRISVVREFSIDVLAFEGNDEKTDSELDEVIGIDNPSRVHSRRQLELAANRIVESYREEGYALCQVDLTLDSLGNNKRAVFLIYEGPRVSIEEIRFEGLVEVTADDLEDVMESGESWFIFNQYYRESRLSRDLVAIEGHLRSRGYLNAKVSLESLIYTNGQSELEIVIRIDEGDLFRVSRVEFSGVEAFPESALRDLIKLEPGDEFDMRIVRIDQFAIQSLYGEEGYIRATVRIPPDLTYALETPTVVVTYHVTEGERKKVRDVIIRGNRFTEDEVVRRALKIYPGQWFNTKEMRTGVNRLSSLGYFSTRSGAALIDLKTNPTDDPESEDLVVDVGEGLLGLLNFSIGTQSGGGAFVGFSIEKPNFDISRMPSSPWALPSEFFSHEAFHGGGQGLSINLLPGTRESRFFIDFDEPYLFGPQELPWSFRLRAFNTESFRQDYDAERLGLRPSIGKFLFEDFHVSLLARSELIDIDNVDDDAPQDYFDIEGKNGVRSLGASVAYDKRDNSRIPTEGYRTELRYEYAGGFLGADFDFSEIEWSSEFHLPVYTPDDEGASDSRHVLFFAAAAGWSEPHGSSDFVPFIERFNGGGQNNYLIRGFRFQGVGPHDGNDPLGGSAAFAANMEYIMPVFSYFDDRAQTDVTLVKAFASMDYGTVEADLESLALDRFRWSVGLGVRIRLPVPILANVPFTIHYGVPLKREEFDRRRSFLFSLIARF